MPTDGLIVSSLPMGGYGSELHKFLPPGKAGDFV